MKKNCDILVEGYQLKKRACTLCDEMGVITVPEGMTPEEIADLGEVPPYDPEIAEVLEECPTCEGHGWYYEEKKS